MKPTKPYHDLSPEQQQAARRRIVKRLASGEKLTHLAAEYGVSRQAIYGWRDVATRDPDHGLDAKPRGRQCYLDGEQLARLRAMLLEGALAHGFPTDLWDLGRVRELIERHFGVRYANKRSLSFTLRTYLDFSPQKPERRAREADPKKIAAWRRRFAAAKKKGAG